MASRANDPFLRHLAAFTQAFGVENAPMVFSMAQVPWPNDEVRNDFIKDMTGINFAELDMYG